MMWEHERVMLSQVALCLADWTLGSTWVEYEPARRVHRTNPLLSSRHDTFDGDVAGT